MASQPTKEPQSIYEFTIKDAKGSDVDLRTYRGKVLLIVNVASKCGMTNSNYIELNQLYEKYKDQGLEVLAFPCNQFGEEEPGSNDQITEFVCTRFKSEFPIFDKVENAYFHAVPNALVDYLPAPCPSIFLSSLLFQSNKWWATTRSIEVNGANAAPVYKFLKSGKWGIFGDDIQWNFAKFLVDKDGQVADRYYPTTAPLSLERDIQKLLGVTE